MPGPAPKHASVRARRNKTSTAATLSAVHQVEMPELPEPDAGGWHPLTIAWWRDIWASPMAPEFEKSDKHGLFILATLVNEFWLSPTKDLAAEIRLQRQAFGLTPMDRRRLQWEIERVDEAQDRGERRREAKPKPATAADDPRGGLYAV